MIYLDNKTLKTLANLGSAFNYRTVVMYPTYISNGYILISKDFIQNAADFMEDGAFSKKLLKAAGGSQVSIRTSNDGTDSEPLKVIGDLADYERIERTNILHDYERIRNRADYSEIWITADESKPPRVYPLRQKSLSFLGCCECYLHAREYLVAHIEESYDEDTATKSLSLKWLVSTGMPLSDRADYYKTLCRCKTALELQNPKLAQPENVPEAEFPESVEPEETQDDEEGYENLLG